MKEERAATCNVNLFHFVDTKKPNKLKWHYKAKMSVLEPGKCFKCF